MSRSPRPPDGPPSRRRRLRPSTRTFWKGIVLASGVLLAIGASAYLVPLDTPADRMQPPGTVVLDASGVVLQRDTSAGIRIPVRLDQVAPIMVDATIAVEDERFRYHPGVDPLAVARAVLTWRDNPFAPLRAGPSGASTITQQLARRLYLDDSDGPKLLRKLREAYTALQIEARLDKDKVLTLYLNDVYYGRGAYGVEAAARVYFDTSARDLDLAQAAFLAGLPQLPAAYDPSENPAAARARQAYVLDRLIATGHAARGEADAALAQGLALLPPLQPPVAPHFVAYALDELRRLRPDLADRPGLVIETTLDAGLQRRAEHVVDTQLARLADRNAGNAAVVVIEPASGRVLTMVGSADFADVPIDGQINMALRPRQPGSALKPFLYAAALEHGLTAATPLLDVPTTFQTDTGIYSPGNYDRRFRGVVPLRVALASSLNVPAVRTLDELGVDALLEIAHRFGLSTLTAGEAYGLSLTLGGGEVRLLDLTAAYGALANAGGRVAPYAVERVRDTTGRVLYERPAPRTTPVLSPEVAYLIGDILSDAEARVPGFGSADPFALPARAAVKTGTTTGFRDNWTLGYTPERVVGVWVGNANNSPMRNISGIDGAAPIWHAVIEAALEGVSASWPAAPTGLEAATVCAPTGLLPGPDCPSPVVEWFVAGTEPTTTESYYLRADDGRLLVDPPAAARGWAAAVGLALTETTTGAPDAAALLVQPPNGSVLFRAPELATSEVLLRAVGPAGTHALAIFVDGSLVASGDGGDLTAVWELAPGFHAIEVTAALTDGRTLAATSRVEVRE